MKYSLSLAWLFAIVNTAQATAAVPAETLKAAQAPDRHSLRIDLRVDEEEEHTGFDIVLHSEQVA